MATTREVVEIIITERGAVATSKKISRVGKASRTAAKFVTGLVVALGTIAGVRAFTGLVKSSIQASAAIEGYTVRLRNLLGSQEDANAAIESFIKLGTKTPFAVSEIIEGAAVLGAAALANKEKLEELTVTAANLAASTGLSFQQASSNLARSLTAGIGAADLFREKGVRPLLEAILGIADATKLTPKELDAAFKSVFGAGGTFGTAAEDLSLTLGGALSNVGDAVDEFKVALGDALSTPVINAINLGFIPFFENLAEVVRENKDEFTTFAAQGISAFIQAMILAIDIGLSFTNTFAKVRLFVITLTGALFEAQLGIVELNVAMVRALDFFGLAAKEGEQSLATQLRLLTLARAKVDAVAEDVGEAERATSNFTQRLAELRIALAKLGDDTSAEKLATAIKKASSGPSIEDLIGKDTGEIKKTADELRKIAALEKELARIARDVRLERDSGGDALERQRLLIDEQIKRVKVLTNALMNQALQDELVNELIRQRGLIGEDAEPSKFEIGAEDALTKGVSAALSGGSVIDALASSIGTSLRESAEEGLKEAIGDVAKSLGESFDEAFGDVGANLAEALGLDDLGEKFGKALGAGVAFAASLAIEALSGTNARQRSAVAGTTSAVTSTQAVRGIVAGPQSIAIAQVGDSITGATAPLIDLTLITNQILADIRDSLSGRGLGASALEPNLAAAAFESGAIG